MNTPTVYPEMQRAQHYCDLPHPQEAASAPIFNLPDDVLSTIFFETGHAEQRSVYTTLKLTWVCSRWRHLIAHDTMLWARIDCPHTLIRPDFLSYALQRARDTPLEIVLTSLHSSSYRNEVQRALLLPLAERARTLVIDGRDKYFSTRIWANKIASRSVTLLELSDVVLDGSIDETTFPSLKTLILRNCRVELAGITAPTVTTLVLERKLETGTSMGRKALRTARDGFSAVGLLKLLRGLSNLTTLKISSDIDEPSHGVVQGDFPYTERRLQLPRLESITIDCFTQTQLENFLQAVTISPKAKVNLDVCLTDDKPTHTQHGFGNMTAAPTPLAGSPTLAFGSIQIPPPIAISSAVRAVIEGALDASSQAPSAPYSALTPLSSFSSSFSTASPRELSIYGASLKLATSADKSRQQQLTISGKALGLPYTASGSAVYERVASPRIWLDIGMRLVDVMRLERLELVSFESLSSSSSSSSSGSPQQRRGPLDTFDSDEFWVSAVADAPGLHTLVLGGTYAEQFGKYWASSQAEEKICDSACSVVVSLPNEAFLQRVATRFIALRHLALDLGQKDEDEDAEMQEPAVGDKSAVAWEAQHTLEVVVRMLSVRHALGIPLLDLRVSGWVPEELNLDEQRFGAFVDRWDLAWKGGRVL